MGILVCQRCGATVEFYDDVKVSTRYTICCSCEEERAEMEDDD